MMTAGQYNAFWAILSPNHREVQHRDCAEQHNGEEQLWVPQSRQSERIVPMAAAASPPITMSLR